MAMDLLLLTALRQETLAVRACLDKWHRGGEESIVGQLGSRRAALWQMGVGAERARRAAARALGAVMPQQAIVLGFAGGLDPALGAGDLVVADRVVHGDESIDLAVDSVNAVGAAVGPVLTVARFVGAPLAKRALYETTNALVVDMESFAVAEVCWQRQVPLSVVRAVTDPAHTTLPQRLVDLVDGSGNLARGQALWQLARSPGIWPEAFRLLRATRRAAAALQRFLRSLPSGGVPTGQPVNCR